MNFARTAFMAMALSTAAFNILAPAAQACDCDKSCTEKCTESKDKDCKCKDCGKGHCKDGKCKLKGTHHHHDEAAKPAADTSATTPAPTK